MKTPVRLWLLAMILGMVFCLSGCSYQTTPATNSSPPSAQKIRRELRTPDTGERLRVHIYGADGVTEVETQIEYVDGRVGYRYFRNNGTLKETREFYDVAGAVVKMRCLYSPDGKAVILQEARRMDNTVQSIKTRLTDGSMQTNLFRKDGKRLRAAEVVRPDTSFQRTFYRQDGRTVWADFTSGPGSSNLRQILAYDETGKLLQKREFPSDDRALITCYGMGVITHMQCWNYQSTGWSKVAVLESVEEYDSGGKIIRKLNMNADGTKVATSTIYKNRSAVSIRYLRDDGTVERQETLDASGKVSKTDTYTPEQRLVEIVEQSSLACPGFDDPTSHHEDD